MGGRGRREFKEIIKNDGKTIANSIAITTHLLRDIGYTSRIITIYKGEIDLIHVFK